VTILGWDASHYDGPLTRTILARARDEGIAFFTHKLAEGLADTEGRYDDTALAAARDAGIEFLGGYLVPRSNASPAAQVDSWLGLADVGEPWWRAFPGWFWQVDLERWPYDAVPAAVGIACARALRARTGRWTILYASHSQYADALSTWDGPLWNADYVPYPAGAPAAMYPGDDWRPLHGTWRGGWAPYSGREPTILQYTSSATIAGLTTCDANAFRGTPAQLRALIEGDTDVDATQAAMLHNADAWAYAVATMQDTVQIYPGDNPAALAPAPVPLTRHLTGLAATLAAHAKQLDSLGTAFAALAAGGTSLDTTAVLAAIKAVGDAESAAVTALTARIGELEALTATAQAREDALRRRLAEALADAP
jgi:hypothetical protein